VESSSIEVLARPASNPTQIYLGQTSIERIIADRRLRGKVEDIGRGEELGTHAADADERADGGSTKDLLDVAPGPKVAIRLLLERRVLGF
jgi:hypothetical protein